MSARLRLVTDEPQIEWFRHTETVQFKISNVGVYQYTGPTGRPVRLQPSHAYFDFTDGVLTSVRIKGYVVRADGTEIPWQRVTHTINQADLAGIPDWAADVIIQHGWEG